MLDGDWRASADAWDVLGCTYLRALALSQGDKAATREALTIMDGLGAQPAAQRIRRTLRTRDATRISAPTRPTRQG